MNNKKIENAVEEILTGIGEDCSREGLLDTPKRVGKMWVEMTEGYHMDIAELFTSVFPSDNDRMVIVKDIPFYSHCEHHMVPFFGKIHIGYIPNKKVLGLSKFARLARIYARRLQIQEQLTDQIANAIEKHLKPIGVMVVIEAQHLCMMMRGVKEVGSSTITSSIRGAFKSVEARSEFLNLIK